MRSLWWCPIVWLACAPVEGDDTGGDDTADTSDTGGDTSDTDTGTDTDPGDTADTDTGDTSDTSPPEPGPPTITSRTPGPDAVDVPLDATVQIVFTEPLESGTINAGGSVSMSGPFGPVGISLVVTSTTITITPTLELAEFHTRYTVHLTSGITDLDGEPLADTTWAFTTVATDPDYRYQLFPLEKLNTVTIQATVLTVDGGHTCLTAARDDGNSAHDWRFQPLAAPWSTLANDAVAAPNSLDGGTAPDNCVAVDATTPTDAMKWQLVDDGACSLYGGTHTCASVPWDGNRVWRLQNATHGSTRSLAVASTYVGMDPIADSDAQRFLIRRNCTDGC